MARDVPRINDGAEHPEGQGHRAAWRAAKKAPAGRRVDHTTKHSHRAFLEFLDPREKVYKLCKLMPPGMRSRNHWCLHLCRSSQRQGDAGSKKKSR